MAVKVIRGKKTNIVNLGENVVEIISIQGKKANQTFFTNIRDYNVTGSQLIAKKVYDEIKVEIEDGVQTEFQKQMEKDFLNGQVSLFGGSINIEKVTSAGTLAQDQRNSVEVSKNGSVLGINVGGLVSLAENVQERTTTTDEPVLSILTDTLDTVSLSEVSTNKDDISTLTGKPTTNGFLNTTVTTGSPSGLNNALIQAKVPAERRRDILKEASTKPDVVEQVTVDVGDATNPLLQIASSFKTQLDVTIKKQNIALGNPLGSFNLNQLGGFGAGPIGLPFVNALGSLIGKLTGITIPTIPGINIPGGNIPSIPNLNDIQTVPSLPTGTVLPQGVTPLPDIIEPTGQTNINKVVKTSTVISPTVKNTVEPRNISSDKGFLGSVSSAKSSSYVFDNIGGPEELKSEIVNATREITTMVVHWSRTFTNLDWGSKEIGQMHTSWQLGNRPKGTDGAAFLAKLGVDSGLQFHYVIKRDGTIQVGRPINIEGSLFTGFGRYALHVAFVGGFNCPSGTPNKENFLSSESFTPQQWNSFDEIIKAFDAAKNGAGEFVGFNQFTRYGMLGPGFDVPEYVSSKYGKATVYLPADFTGADGKDALSSQEIITRKPQKPVVNPTPPNNPAPEPIVLEVPGEPTDDEAATRNAKWQQLKSEGKRLRGERIELIEKYENAQITNQQEADKLRVQIDAKVEKIKANREELSKMKKDFINDGYYWDRKENLWINPDLSNIQELSVYEQAALVPGVTYDDTRGRFRALNQKTNLYEYFDDIESAERYTLQ